MVDCVNAVTVLACVTLSSSGCDEPLSRLCSCCFGPEEIASLLRAPCLLPSLPDVFWWYRALKAMATPNLHDDGSQEGGSHDVAMYTIGSRRCSRYSWCSQTRVPSGQSHR